LLFKVASTAGIGTSDLTLGSHGSASRAFAKASPASDLCAGSSSQRDAVTTSSGNVEAIRTWVSRSSGYNAIDASNASSCSALKGWSAVGWDTAAGVVCAIASSGNVALSMRQLVSVRIKRPTLRPAGTIV
jgi:hypothetical protein